MARRCLTGLVLVLFGCVVGGLSVRAWDRARRPAVVLERVPGRSWEATLYLPVVTNQGLPFPDDEFQTALELLIRDFGGATVGEKREGYWLDGQSKINREPVRPVVVTFGRGRLDDFRRTVREVGRRLGQECIYYRLEELGVELLAVESGPAGEP